MTEPTGNWHVGAKVSLMPSPLENRTWGPACEVEKITPKGFVRIEGRLCRVAGDQAIPRKNNPRRDSYALLTPSNVHRRLNDLRDFIDRTPFRQAMDFILSCPLDDLHPELLEKIKYVAYRGVKK